MAAPPSCRDQVLCLLAAANNRGNGDLSVKTSSLKQAKDLLLSIDPSLAADIYPYLLELQSSPETVVRKSLIQIIEVIGFKAAEHSPKLISALLAFLGDSDVAVVKQSIVSGSNIFSSGFEELVVQFQQCGKVERWLEEIWMWMQRFKDAVFGIALKPGDVEIKELALKFLETFVLLFTTDINDPEKSVIEGVKQAVNISWLVGGHPVLDPVVLMWEANKTLGTLSNLLQSASSLPDCLSITVVNCLSSVARKRPQYYDTILSAMLDFDPNFQIEEGCKVDNLNKNGDLSTCDARVSKDELPSTQSLASREVSRKRPLDNEPLGSGHEAIYKLIRAGPGPGPHLTSPAQKNDTRKDQQQEEFFHHELDWRTKGAVTSVKEQKKKCYSCWAFSSVGAVEGIHQIMSGSLLELSAQELIDCDPNSSGSEGGQHCHAFSYIKEKGVSLDIDYPYVGLEKSCRKDELSRQRQKVHIDGYEKVPVSDQDLLLAVKRQPVAVKLRFPNSVWGKFREYTGGMYKGSSYEVKKDTTCHGMLIVGYGCSSRGRNYWILKNSWGTEWGMGGYMYFLRSTDNPQGICDINKNAYYPTKNAPSH